MPHQTLKPKHRTDRESPPEVTPSDDPTSEVRAQERQGNEGTDKLVAARLAKDGWEPVDSDAGRTSTTLAFRRPRKPINWLLIGGGAAAVLVLAVVVSIGTALENDETKPDASPHPTASAIAAPSDKEPSRQPEKQVEPDVLTAESNADLAAVLAGPKKGRAVEAFSENYRTRVVEFDAFVTEVYVNPRESLCESTISMRAGAAKDKTHTGPVFVCSWYGHDSPMEKFAEGTSVRVRAMVGALYEFEPHQFFLVAEDDDALTAR